MITIIDYQMGNLRSVQKALERVGVLASISSDPHEIASADKVVLPGVGAFRDAIQELRRRDLTKPICDAIAQGKPFLGICLGLQLLFDRSYEDGEWEGLGILRGSVQHLNVPADFKVPHMGWNQIQVLHPSPLLDGIADGAHFYFVHSYRAVPDDPSVIAVESVYGQPFCAAVARDNIFATQFHPEKSQANGLRLLENFARA